eukprot:1147597-Pelagomonas_calceolata.AAC.2
MDNNCSLALYTNSSHVRVKRNCTIMLLSIQIIFSIVRLWAKAVETYFIPFSDCEPEISCKDVLFKGLGVTPATPK